jgi:hypothetical protein
VAQTSDSLAIPIGEDRQVGADVSRRRTLASFAFALLDSSRRNFD